MLVELHSSVSGCGGSPRANTLDIRYHTVPKAMTLLLDRVRVRVVVVMVVTQPG